MYHRSLHFGLVSVFLFAIAMVTRIPGLFWGFHYVSGGPLMFIASDEITFVKHFLPFIRSGVIERQDYFFGFAREAMLALEFFMRADEQVTSELILMSARLMNILFACGTVLVVFFLANSIFQSFWKGFLSAVIFCFLPLHVWQSHLATPAASFVFWYWAAILCFYEFSKRNSISWWYAAWLCAGGACATKYGFICLIPGLIILFKNRTLRLSLAPLVFAIFFLYLNLWWMPWDLYNGLKTSTIPDNFYERSHSRWVNLASYLIGFVPSLTLPIFIFAFIGIVWRVRKIPLYQEAKVFYILELPLLVQFLVLLCLTSAFNRHLLIFMPYMALLAAFILSAPSYANSKKPAGLFLIVIVIAYQISAVANLEYNFLGNRYFQAIQWLAKHKTAQDKIYFPSSWEFNDTLGQVVPENWRSREIDASKFALVSDKVIWRMKRSTLNPFTKKVPPLEIYHSGMIDDFKVMSRLLFEESNFKKAVVFSSIEYLPEYKIYKELFTTFTDEYGDVAIYERE